MNWLLISSDTEKRELMKASLNELFPKSIIYESSTEMSDLQNMYGILGEISCCVVISDNIVSGCELIVGYLCGKNIHVITDACLDKEVFGCFESLVIKKNMDEICKSIKRNRKKLEDEVKRKEAFDYLFAHGIPFNPDHFSKYIEKGALDICECYLTAGMDINSRDRDGTPMLSIAVRNDNAETVKWLLKKGADVNAISEDRGYSALMDAVWRGNKEIVLQLLEKNPDVNIISKEGQTMIILAVGAENVEICRLLCQKGADVDIVDEMGMSAYGYARLFKKERILSILEKYHKES